MHKTAPSTSDLRSIHSAVPKGC